jgi:uncharacterized protein
VKISKSHKSKESAMKNIILTAILLLSAGMHAQQNSATSGHNPKESDAKTSSPAAGSSTGSPRIDAAKEADLRRLMELTGAKGVASDAIDGMMTSIRPLMMSSLPPGAYREQLTDLFFEKFRSKADLDKMIELAVQAYDKYYSEQEVKELIRFYETPLGHKMATVTPKLSSELREQGQQWGRNLGRESMADVLNEHPDLRKALEDAGKAQQNPGASEAK